VERKVLRSRRLRVDTTVVESDTRRPTDSGLCAHAVARLTRLGKRIQAAGLARRTPLRDLVPVEVDPNDLGAQALQRAEGELRIAVQRHRVVLNADEHVLLRLRRGHL